MNFATSDSDYGSGEDSQTGSSLPKRSKKKAPNKEHRSRSHFYREELEPKKLASSGSSFHLSSFTSRGVVLANDLLKKY
jgi:hypothetical protein